ncbi:2Fe-2S iron-sulfur cluster-binding protein [Altererythrobacter aquiaggeris]|uniref:2Fe-2S iron-sulfur cluster-binding protein n=1 Tax=Aestuarierythrobacter aquiaggeris TaxID=1898396 RepID=UPI003019B73F
MTVKVKFVSARGDMIDTCAERGISLLEAGQAAGLPLEGTCEGQMACSTCHVIVAREWFGKLVAASEEEEDMLDLAAGVQPTSRLSCQIDLTDELDGLEVHVPGESRDMRGL